MREHANALPLTAALARLIDRCHSLRQLQQIHARVIVARPSLGHDATAAVLTRLLFAAASSPSSSSSLHYAAVLFRRLPAPPTLFAYNALIRANSFGFCSHLNPLSLYSQMLSSGVRPDHLTFPFLFKYCSHILNSVVGQCLHVHVLWLGVQNDVYIQNSMIHMYATCGLIDCAGKLFEVMPLKDIVSWNSMLIGCLRHGELDLALDLFLVMRERNVITWNSIITGFVQAGRSREALDLFHEMLILHDDHVKPNKITIASVISACSSLGALDQGKWVHGYLKRHSLEFDVVIGTALIDMYGKCGCVERAIEVFEKMPKKDVLAWTAMILVFAVHGLAEEAFALLEQMERHQVMPNHVTFGALLRACAHSGLVEKGLWCFDRMKATYLIEPQRQHYACMVDLLGRAALFEEAERLIRSMPMEPDLFVWGALLGACRMHGNVEVGERVANYLIGLDPQNHAFYIALSDICAKAKRFGDAKRIRSFMEECGIRKTTPGCSMIEVDGQVLEFSAKRVPKDLRNEIEWVLDVINVELRYNFPHHDADNLQAEYVRLKFHET
ncbi:Pentatricopeptide repeat-containing protein [Musa troglodytarum]|uniref:Pentatricopeptide repeat-containing protein n=2 Tax=Musa troglodytarum TaxID=320322 RepID=A0A9E7JR86_9LILI|nr:Pentatricopeptide repeat-containing protein [Musa troglodytarum]